MSSLPEIPTCFNGRRYHVYNDWAKIEFGGRLQKVSIDAGFTCPNRDGSLGVGGCTFCNNEGFSPSYLREQPDVLAQIAWREAFVVAEGAAADTERTVAVGAGEPGVNGYFLQSSAEFDFRPVVVDVVTATIEAGGNFGE